MEVGAEAGHTTEALSGGVQVVAENDGESVWVVGNTAVGQVHKAIDNYNMIGDNCTSIIINCSSFSPMLLDGSASKLLQGGQTEVRASPHEATGRKGVTKEVQRLQGEPWEGRRQNSELVAAGREELERRHLANRPRQHAELVAVQPQVDELLKEGEGAGKTGEAVPCQVQEPQATSQSSTAEDTGKLCEFVASKLQLSERRVLHPFWESSDGVVGEVEEPQ